MKRNIVITGASRGIGLAIAQKLLDHSETITSFSRTAPSYNDPRLKHQFLDLTKPFDPQKLAAKYAATDTLIIAAGVGHFGFCEQLSFAQIEEVMQVNFTSQALLVRAFLPFLKQQEKADLLFIGSEAALNSSRRGSIYSASKYALRGFAKSLQQECTHSQLRVSLLHPGLTTSSFYAKTPFFPADKKTAAMPCEEVAEAALWLLSRPDYLLVDELSLFPKKPEVIWAKKKPEESLPATRNQSID
jgi:3-hydroxy acid dehydrogenase / malonic semialdehyde reductase